MTVNSRGRRPWRRSQVDHRRLRRELPGLGVGVAGDEDRHRAVAAVGRDPRAARHAGEPSAWLTLTSGPKTSAVAGREAAAAQAQAAAAGEVDAVAGRAVSVCGSRSRRGRDPTWLRCARLRTTTVGRLAARASGSAWRRRTSGAVVVAAAIPSADGDGRGSTHRRRAARRPPPATKHARAPRADEQDRGHASPPRAPRRSRRSRCAGPTGSTARRRRSRRPGGRCW